MDKKILFALIALMVLLVGCGSSIGESGIAPEEMLFMESQDIAGAAPEPYYDEDSNKTAINVDAVPVERMVIKNAELAIITVDPAQSMDEIGRMAESMGGFVVSSNLYQRTLSSGAKVPQANITIRVPIERLDEALQQIKAGATEVESENTSGQDVTQEYTDLQSQLRNLEAAEAQLMEIMEGASETEDVLSIYNELVYLREQIEVIKGRIQYYEQSAALSKIDVSITADEAVQPIQVGGWQPSGVAKEAIEMLIQTLQFLATAGIWIVLCILPVGLIIGVPLYFVGRFVIRTRKRRKATKQEEAILPEED
jgi:hypothetical protein